MTLLTYDLLKRLNACEWGKNFLKQHPEAENMPLKEVGAKYEIPYEALFWVEQQVSLDADERKVFQDLIEVTDSLKTYKSYRISNSENIIDSHDVTGSHFVRSSANITNSETVRFSQNVTRSDHVYNSFYVSDSYQIIGSKNVSDSHKIINSTFISKSANIYVCEDILDSFGLRNCRGVTNSYYSTSCSTADNLLFCFDLHDKPSDKYYVFNEETTPGRFKIILNQLQHFLADFTYVDSWQSDYAMSRSVVFNANHNTHYTISKDMQAWLETLPMYNEEVLYNITTLI